MTAPLARKRVWTVADFAKHAWNDDSEAACLRARRFLKRLDAKHHGKLLVPSDGANRMFTFYPALLAKLEPDLFTPVQSIEFRLEVLEDEVSEVKRHQKVVVGQVGANTRRIEQQARKFEQLRLGFPPR